MIVALTANPSVDRTLLLARLRRGAVHRAGSVLVEPSGKGVNVARALAANGHPTTALLPLGGVEGARLGQLLHEIGVAFTAVPIADPIRSNITLLEDDGVATKVNEPGPRLTEEEAAALVAATETAGATADWTVCCGSLPPGVPVDFYARIVERVHARGGRVAVDTAGPALRLAAESGADLLKPNLEELTEVAGRSLATLGDVVDAAGELCRLGARAVLASLGPDGAVLISDDEASVRHGQPPPVAVVSPVGAGDALLAGFLAAAPPSPTGAAEAIAPATARSGTGVSEAGTFATARTWRGALRTALAWAAACCATPTCETPAVPPEAADKVVVTDRPDLRRPLTPPS